MDMDKTPLVSVVVVNWNGRSLLPACLGSVAAQTWPRVEIWVVDNGSTDGSVEWLRAWAAPPDRNVLFLDHNSGFARANNLAFAQARGEWVALLNNDAVAEPGWLAELLRHADLAGRVAMLGGKILLREPGPKGERIDKVGHLIYPDGLNRGRGSGEPDRGQYDRLEGTIWPDGCAAVYHHQLLAETGGFDERFFAYGDDADLGIRARVLGWRARYVPGAVVRHHHSATAGRYSPRKAYLVERNRIWLMIKSFPLEMLLLSPFWSVWRYLWQARGALRGEGAPGRFVDAHGRRHLLGVLVRAQFDALRGAPAMWAARRRLHRGRRLSPAATRAMLRKYRLPVRDVALRD